MPLILGIDTGGTYTDSVIIERSTKKIQCKAKSLTTKENLIVGIANSIENMNFCDYGLITMVCLSTTLATNAIVENSGCKTALLLIGKTPEGILPNCQTLRVSGQIDIKGREIQALDENEIHELLKSVDTDTKALAVSGFASVRNPVHELKIKKMITQYLGIPVVCAHELTSTLGYYERTVTAVLNASLIPIIEELITATKAALDKKNIKAPIMLVKGDGSLMQEFIAAERPIETILSGPAASIIGGIFLSNRRNALIADMGGTTTDIAFVKNGTVDIRKEGARVGGWRTRVQAANICTFGIGGDSWIRPNSNGHLIVGPRKVTPFCIAGTQFPSLIDELLSFANSKEYHRSPLASADCFIKTHHDCYPLLCDEEKKIIELFDQGPKSIFTIAKYLGVDTNQLNLSSLVNRNILTRIALTPTDVLHAQGRYTTWNCALPNIAIKIMSDYMGKSSEKLLELAELLITNTLLNAFKECDFEFEQPAELAINEARTIVAIGGPVAAWMKPVADQMIASLHIPPHAEVANAIGAAVGDIKETVEALIRPIHNKDQFIFYAPWERKIFGTLCEAKQYGIAELRKHTELLEKRAGSTHFYILESCEDIRTESYLSGEMVYIETRIRATAIGKPDWV